jgi:hypothetical protein
MDNIAVHDWQRVHSARMQKERGIARPPVLLARGTASQRHADRAYLEIAILRERSEALFRRALKGQGIRDAGT